MDLIKNNLYILRLKRIPFHQDVITPSSVLNMNVINSPFQTMLSNPENGHLFKKTMNC